MIGQNIHYSRVNCVLGPSKSIHYSGDFVKAGFVIGGFLSTYFTVSNSVGLSNVVRCNRVFFVAGFIIAGCHLSLIVPRALSGFISIGFLSQSTETNLSKSYWIGSCNTCYPC